MVPVVEAIGIFNVCVLVAELNAGAVPDVPTAKVCDPEVNPFKEISPLPATPSADQLAPL